MPAPERAIFRLNGRLARMGLLIGVYLAWALSGCVGEAGPPGEARAWLRALTRGDGLKLGELTCDASQPTLQNAALLYSILGILSERVAGERPKADIGGLSFRTLRRDKTTAEVQVTGRIRLALLLVSQASQVDFVMPMRYERGRWRYCEGPRGASSAPGYAELLAQSAAGPHLSLPPHPPSGSRAS